MSQVPLSTAAQLPAIEPKPPKSDDPVKIREAAEQFEGLLLAQILQSSHDEDGWLGSGEDSSSSCAGGFAEQQLALMMAHQGGFGLTNLISEGLERGRQSRLIVAEWPAP